MVDKHSPGIMFEMSMVAPGLKLGSWFGKVTHVTLLVINLAAERIDRAGEKRNAIYA